MKNKAEKAKKRKMMGEELVLASKMLNQRKDELEWLIYQKEYYCYLNKQGSHKHLAMFKWPFLQVNLNGYSNPI